MPQTLQSLLAHLRTAELTAAESALAVEITSVTADSRTVQPGTLFVAIRGGTADGHRYLPDAARRGAAAALGTVPSVELAAQGIAVPPELPYLLVTNARLALAVCAAALQDFPSRTLTVVGVTGTDGKTTTSSLIEGILATATRTEADQTGAVGVITTVGARIRGEEIDTGFHVTTPDAPDVQRFLAQMRDAGCRYAVVESTSHGLDQERVGAVDFDLAVVTNITHEHLDYHGTRDAYVAAKAKLFRALFHSPRKPGIPRCAVLNADDAGSFEALRTVLVEETAQREQRVTVRSYGIAGVNPAVTPDVVAEQPVYAPDRTHFTIRWWGGEFGVESPLIGEFNVHNVLGAVTAALALGVNPTIIQTAIAHFPGVLGRMERINRGQSFTAVVDFAHTPVSLERALMTLRPLVGSSGRLIAVFGSAGLRDRAKRYLMGRVSGQLADFTVITAEDPRTEDLDAINAEIARGVREFADERRFTIVPDRTAAIQFAVDMAAPGDIVAAFGKGHERSMCFGETEYPWSDQDAMAAALEKRRLAAGCSLFATS
jgi:UDP-N-acetylmuramoyl-L-alanyl-D-glutamate--2,6-diaminopimelate ligase